MFSVYFQECDEVGINSKYITTDIVITSTNINMSLSIFPEMSVMFEEQYGQYSNHCNSTDYDMPITSRFRRLLPRVTTAHTKACIEISNEDSGYFIEILRLDEKSNINSKIAEIEELKPNRKNCGGNTSDLQYSVSYLTDENADLRKHIIELEHDVEKQMHEYKTKSQSLQDIEETYKQLIHENSKYIEQLKSEIEELKSQLLEKDSQIFDYEHLEKGVHDGMHGFVNPNSLTSFCKCDTELQGKCMLLQRQHTEDLEEKDSKIKALTDALSQERIKCKNMQECTRDENKFHTAISDGNISRESEHLDVCSDLIEAEYQECHSTEGAYKEESNFSSEGILTEAALETTNDKDTIKQQTSELNNMKEYLAENSKRINDLEAQNEDLLGDINLKIQHIKSLEAEILSHDSEVMDLREEINILNNVGTTGINEAQNVEDEISSLKLAIVKEQEDSNTLQIKLKIFENKYEQLQGQIKTQQSFSMDLEQEKCNLQKELYKLKYQEEKKNSNLEQLKLIKAGENKIESLSHQIEYISKENEKCKTSNDKLMIDILSLRTQLKKMTQENRDNKDTIKQQMNELNKSKEYVMEKTKHIVDLETKNEDLQDDLNLKIRHIKNLEAEMLLENSAICDRREDVTKLNSGRTTGVNETQHLQDEISTLKLTIVKNIEKNNTLQTRLKRCEQNYEQLLGEIELQQSINMKLEQEKCTIEEELDKLKYQTEKRGKNIEQLMLIKASETKIESLSNQIENLRTENEKLKTSNGKLMNDISSLQKHIKENTRSRISELVAVSEKHKGTCDQLMKENISLKDSLENEIKEKTIITNYKDNENVLILQYKDEIASLKMENGATLKSLEQLQKENNVERQALLAKDQKIEDLSNRLTVLLFLIV